MAMPSEKFVLCLSRHWLELSWVSELVVVWQRNVSNLPVISTSFLSCRMVNSTNSSTILKAVRAALKNSSYQFKEENAKIISGEEEAIGGWTTTNYLDKNLNPPKEVSIGIIYVWG